MLVNTYENAVNFLQENELFLEREEAANNLILGFSHQVIALPKAPAGYYFWSVQEAGVVVLCAMRNAQGNLLIYGAKEFVSVLAKHLWEKEIKLVNLAGERQLAKAFAEAWQKQTGAAWKVRFRDLAHRLDQVRAIPMAPGQLRLALETDFDPLHDWMYAFKLMMGEDDRAGARKSAMERIASGNLYVWEDDQVVSMANLARPSRHGITINYVYTPKIFRGKGYASSCVAALSQKMLSSGKQFCALFTDETNATSNKIYKAIGYEQVMATYFISFS